MRIIQSLLSCARKNDIDRKIRQLEKTVLAKKLVNADNTLSATLRSIKPVQNDNTKGLRSCLKNASVEKRLHALEHILQKNMEHYVSGFNIEDKNAIMLSYYSGKLNSCIDHHAERFIYADPERASNNLKSYRQALLDAVFTMNVPPGLTEGGPSILLD